MKIEMERHQLISLLLACDAADTCASPDTKKWKKLHVQLMHVLLEYDSDMELLKHVESTGKSVGSMRRVYKLEKEVEV